MASTGETWRLGHRPALDGLRSIAVALVVLKHVEAPGLATAGVVGVTLFFTLSGFLITALLLEESTRSGRIDFRGFYRRRALRLLPAMLTMIGVVSALALVLGPAFATPQWIVAASLYLSNFAESASGPAGALDHTWTLSVEEQFYLVWPLLLSVAIRAGGRRAAAVLAGAGVAAALLARPALWADGAGWWRIEYGTVTHLDALSAGALLAMVLVGSRRTLRVPTWAVEVAIVGLLLACALPFGYAELVLAPTVVPWLTVVAIAGCVQTDSPRWLQRRPLATVGRRSYGIYLWHWPAAVFITLASGGRLSWWVELAILLPVAAALTTLSWRYVEAPFLKLKDRARSADTEPVGREHVRACDAAVSA